jgi:ubiquinone/menaquinone biosynthesis C-methylase UbiE
MMSSYPQWQGVIGSAAEAYERHLVPAMFAPWASDLIDSLSIQTGERVLDVACGTGVVTRLAATQAGSGGQVVGLDINPAMLVVARSVPAVRGASVEWLEASALEIPLPDTVFDVVLCQQGLQQFPDRPTALKEMHRVLADGGRFAASVWSRIEGSPGMAALVEALEQHVSVEAANNRRAPFALGDADELRALVTGAGFHDIRVQTLVKFARFPSPEVLVEAQLAATPLATLGVIHDDIRQSVAQDVRRALQLYLQDDDFAVPMEAHVITARR